jgi:two-component sensor histidine kinase
MRPGAIQLIHENLYRPENLAHLNLTSYLKHLCASLLRTAGPVSANVRIESGLRTRAF